MADPIFLNTDDDVVDFAKALRADGWQGQVSFGGRDAGETTPTDKLKASKGKQTIDARTGYVLVPVDEGARYLTYPRVDFEALQAAMGGSL